MSFSTIYRETAEKSPLIEKFERYLQPGAANDLEQMAKAAHQVTRQNFGRTIRMFAPLYVSNECINNCSYCGFSRDNPILRVTLAREEVIREARHLLEQGFRQILLVAGEHPRFVTEGYLQTCLEDLRELCPGLSIEVGPMETPEYRQMVEAGCEALVVYQETYDREAYARYHTAGPKKDFDWRLDCPERGYDAGFRRLGIGALFGLSDWRTEAVGLARHLEYLQKVCWKSSFTVSFPRLRPAAGGFHPEHILGDADYVKLVCAFRLCFPQVGIVLSTREPRQLRDSLVPLGITHMSAGSHTEPGGYTGAGSDDLHLTVKGRRQEIEDKPHEAKATEQFGIADTRSAAEVAAAIQRLGYEPVWKDWDSSLLARPLEPAPLAL